MRIRSSRTTCVSSRVRGREHACVLGSVRWTVLCPQRGETALILAAHNGHDAAVHALIDAGADKAVKDTVRAATRMCPTLNGLRARVRVAVRHGS